MVGDDVLGQAWTRVDRIERTARPWRLRILPALASSQERPQHAAVASNAGFLASCFSRGTCGCAGMLAGLALPRLLARLMECTVCKSMERVSVRHDHDWTSDYENDACFNFHAELENPIRIARPETLMRSIQAAQMERCRRKIWQWNGAFCGSMPPIHQVAVIEAGMNRAQEQQPLSQKIKCIDVWNHLFAMNL